MEEKEVKNECGGEIFDQSDEPDIHVMTDHLVDHLTLVKCVSISQLEVKYQVEYGQATLQAIHLLNIY